MKELTIMISSIAWDPLRSPRPVWAEHGFEPLTITPVVKGERLIIVGIKDKTTFKKIFEQIHDVDKFQEWLSCAFLHIFDPPPACLDRSINLLESIHQFYETAPDEPDDEFDARIDEIYKFRKTHDIRYGFIGCDVPSVLLGSKYGQTCIWYSCDGEYIEESVIINLLTDNLPHPQA